MTEDDEYKRVVAGTTPARLVCVECDRLADDTARGWRAYLLATESQIVIYCPRCAQREFEET